MKRLVAVYGTLKQGQGNHRVMGKSKLLGTHVTEAKYTMYDNGGFPFVYNQGNTPITIEVYEVTDRETSDNINRLEGYSGTRDNPRNWYDTVDVDTPYGLAEMFITKTPKNLQEITSGVW